VSIFFRHPPSSLLIMGQSAVAPQPEGLIGVASGPRVSYAVSWTFRDKLRSVDCNASETEAQCVRETNSTSPILQIFPAAGRHVIRFKVHTTNPSCPLGFGVMPMCAKYNGGSHHVGEVELTRSVGLVSHRGASHLLAKGANIGDAAPAIREGAEVEVRVEAGTLRVLVDDVQYGPTFGGLTGRLRFGVSLCGTGQKVEILSGSGSMAGALADGFGLAGRRVRIKDPAALQAALQGLPLISEGVLASGGKDGHIETYDDSDDTYKVRFSDCEFWYTLDCLGVLPSHYPETFNRLAGRSLRIRSAADLIRLGWGLLGAACLVDLANRSGTAQSFDESSGLFTIRFEDGKEIEAPRGAFDFALDAGRTRYVPGNWVKADDRHGMVLAADMDGPGCVLVRWSDGQEICSPESELSPAPSPGTNPGAEADGEGAAQRGTDTEEVVIAALKRTLEGLGAGVVERGGNLILDVLGVGVSCRWVNGVVLFKAETVAELDLSYATEVSVVLNELQRDKVLGRLDLDSDGDVSVTVANYANDTPLTTDQVVRVLQVLGQLIREVRPKLGPFISRGPGQTFVYHSGVRYSSIKAFDISDEACHRHAPFSHGDRVRDPSDGETATVIGVRPDGEGQERLWYHADGRAGAGVYAPDTERTLVKIGHQVVESACP